MQSLLFSLHSLNVCQSFRFNIFDYIRWTVQSINLLVIKHSIFHIRITTGAKHSMPNSEGFLNNLCHVNPTFHTDLLKINYNIIFPSRLGLFRRILPVGLSVKVWKHAYIFSFWLHSLNPSIFYILLAILGERIKFIKFFIVKLFILSSWNFIGVKYSVIFFSYEKDTTFDILFIKLKSI